MYKKITYPAEDWKLDNGGRVLWSEGVKTSHGRGAKVRTKCVVCGKPGWAEARNALAQGLKFPALHKECYRKIRSSPDAQRYFKKYQPPKRTDEITLPKGTRVLYGERIPGNHQLVGIECRGCFEKTRTIKYVQRSSVAQYLKGQIYWDELCSDCIRERGSLKKNTKDKKSKVSDTITLFSQEKEGMVPVLAAACQHTWLTTRVNAVNNWDIYIEICPDCQHNPRALARRLAELAASGAGNGNEHTEKRRPRLDREQFKRRVKKFILEAWAETDPKLPTREDVAKKFMLRGLKPTTGAGVKDGLIRCEVTDDWDVFVRKVIDEAATKPAASSTAKV